MPKASKKIKPDIVNKHVGGAWIYSDAVKEHFFKPKNLLIDNPDEAEFDAVGTVGSPACGDVMRIWLKIDSKKDKITQFKWRTFGCLPPGQIIFTPEGLKPIESLTFGDEVFSGSGDICKVIEPSKRSYDGDLITFTPLISRINAFSVTPEHPIYAIKRRGLKSAGQQKHTIYRRIGGHSLDEATPEYIPAKNLEIGDFLVYRYPKIEEDRPEINDKLLRLIGYYLSEGYFSANDKNGIYGAINFAVKKDESLMIKDISEIIMDLFDKRISKRTRDNVTELYVCSRLIIRLMEKYCGHYARNKKLHPDLLLLPVRKQQILLDAYFKGDGHIHHDHRGTRADTITFSTASQELAFQLQIIIARSGYFAKIRDRIPAPSEINGRKIKNNLQYTVTYIKNLSFRSVTKQGEGVFYIPIGKITRNYHQTEVHNIMVNSKNPSYLAKGFVVHNCASAIAATSMLSVMVTEKGGMKIDQALKITPKDILNRLGGLPDRKIHCSVLGDKGLQSALNDYFKKTEQYDRVILEGAKVLDPHTKTTEADIEDAVLEGARTMEEVQQRTKVGIGYPECLSAVEQLIRFYKEKHFGKDEK